MSVLWEDPGKEVEDKLFVRGAMVYVPEKDCWHVQPALRTAIERYASAELCRRAVAWYEEHGHIQDALTCCWYLRDHRFYRECLIRNYDKVPFLNYEKLFRAGETEDVPELFYLKWMEAFLRQDVGQMKELRTYLPGILKESTDNESDRRKAVEIFLNIAYTDPEITTKEWMEMLRQKSDPKHPVRLYFMLGSQYHICAVSETCRSFCLQPKREERIQIDMGRKAYHGEQDALQAGRDGIRVSDGQRIVAEGTFSREHAGRERVYFMAGETGNDVSCILICR